MGAMDQNLLGLAAEGEVDEARHAGLHDEIAFWRSLFDRSNPNQRFIDFFHQRVRTESPLQPQLEKLLSSIPAGSAVKVLDVGCGPFTHIGTVSDR